MLAGVPRQGGTVRVCGTCMDACGLADADQVAGAARSAMAELAELTDGAGKVLVFRWPAAASARPGPL